MKNNNDNNPFNAAGFSEPARNDTNSAARLIANAPRLFAAFDRLNRRARVTRFDLRHFSFIEALRKLTDVFNFIRAGGSPTVRLAEDAAKLFVAFDDLVRVADSDTRFDGNQVGVTYAFQKLREIMTEIRDVAQSMTDQHSSQAAAGVDPKILDQQQTPPPADPREEYAKQIHRHHALGFMWDPWILEQADDGRIILTHIKGHVICTFEPGDAMMENARLISAAPELFDAVEGLVHWIDREEENVYCPSWRGTMLGSQAAVYKAAGREYREDLFLF